MTFGEYFKACRMRTGWPLATWSWRCDFNTAYVRKIEHGLAIPGIGEDMARYARALQLKRHTPEWVKFHVLAANGRFRKRLPLTEQELVAELPHPAAIPRGVDMGKFIDFVCEADSSTPERTFGR